MISQAHLDWYSNIHQLEPFSLGLPAHFGSYETIRRHGVHEGGDAK